MEIHDPETIHDFQYFDKVLVGYDPPREIGHAMNRKIILPAAYAPSEFVDFIAGNLIRNGLPVTIPHEPIVEIAPYKKYFSSKLFYKRFFTVILKGWDIYDDELDKHHHYSGKDTILVPSYLLAKSKVEDCSGAVVRVSAQELILSWERIQLRRIFIQLFGAGVGNDPTISF